MSLAERRRCVAFLVDTYQVSERHACQAMNIHRSSYRFVGKRGEVDATHERIVAVSRRYDYWGYRKIYALLRDEQVRVSRERVRLVRRREGLQLPKKQRKRKPLGMSTTRVNRARHPGHVWSYDFVFDQTLDGRRLKCLTVLDEFTRQGLAVDIARSLTARDVVATLARLFAVHGRPQCIRSDNGPELVANAVQKWLGDQHVGTHYIAPGSPWENAYCESFNSILRTTCLNRWVFSSMLEARVVCRQWLDEYNRVRPHGALRGMNPEQYLRQWQQDEQVLQPKSLTL
ncbi:MAG: IS3 family transposase [Gammaproteobacteria bacterium]|nr:IS3 family transposase [Gammaproteobacteria bacterium]